MTEVQQKPAIAGFFGTIAVWILIFLFFYFSAILFAPKQYKTIKIRLDAPQKMESEQRKQSEQLAESSEQLKNSEQESATSQAKDVQNVKDNTQKGEVSPSLQPPTASSATPSPKGQSPLKSPEFLIISFELLHQSDLFFLNLRRSFSSNHFRR